RPVCKFNFAQVQGFLAFLHFFLAPVEPFFALIFFVCMILDSFSVDTNYYKKITLPSQTNGLLQQKWLKTAK
ncbi:MAG: hypothetical protein IJ828_11730, partial [Treponema sp.]|nr:hypothetical protein [Treponema sp.]